MYLERRTYVKRWSHQKPEQKYSVLVKKAGKKDPNINPEKISYVIEEVAYWRKANQIHKWFVENCVESADWHGEAVYVSRDKIKELVELCEKVLKASKLVKGMIKNGETYKDGKWEPIMQPGKYIKDPTVAKELLPNEDGFFFGSQEYDQYYVDDLKETIKQLKPYTEDKENVFADFEYSASW